MRTDFECGLTPSAIIDHRASDTAISHFSFLVSHEI